MENYVEQVELSSNEGKDVASVAANDIISQFDEILGRQLDRLLGTRQGIQTLPMNIFTVSCLILLATRETEIESFPYLPPERYTNDSLISSLAEMNIESGSDLESSVKSMKDKGYINIVEDGRFFSGPPAMKMAQLFDRIFPRMPGLNLVAYLGQMIDEVFSKRKDLKNALNQFDQMLNLHGVSLKKDADSQSKENAKYFPHLKVSEPTQPAKKRIIAADLKPSDIFSRLQTKSWTATQVKPEVPVASFEVKAQKTEKDQIADLSRNEDLAERSMVHEESEVKGPGQISNIYGNQDNDGHMEDITPEQPDEVSEDEATVPSIEKDASISKYKPGPGLYEKAVQPEDDDIEKSIASFEEQLGLACPLCRTSGILPLTTAKGKPYYKCSNEACNFISWGKPYYITCPRCENPFLIESPDNQGNMMLKCPRATCPHWQKLPWEEDDETGIKSNEPVQSTDTDKKPRRVVKRRRRVVVRRKS